MRKSRKSALKLWRQGRLRTVVPPGSPSGDESENGGVLQSIIDRTPSGSTVRLPEGRFGMSSPLIVEKPVHIVGGEVTELVNLSPGSPLVRILSGEVIIEGLVLVGAGSFVDGRKRTRHGDAIVVGDRKRKLSDVTLRSLWIENAGDEAIAIEGGNRKRRNAVSGVRIENVRLRGVGAVSNYHSGVYIHGGDDIAIGGCDISGFGQCVLTTALTRDVRIVGNVLHDTSRQHGVYLSGATESAKVLSNTIYDVAGSGVKCSAPMSLIANNRIVRPRIWGINLKADLHDVEVSDNVIVDAGNDGIDSGFERPGRTQSDIRILRNVIVGAGDNGINFSHDEDNCTYRKILVQGNSISEASAASIRFRWNDVRDSMSEELSFKENRIVRCHGPSISVGREFGLSNGNRVASVVVAGNTIEGCGDGGGPAISIVGASAVNIEDNVIADGSEGSETIFVDHSVDISLKRNSFPVSAKKLDSGGGKVE